MENMQVHRKPFTEIQMENSSPKKQKLNLITESVRPQPVLKFAKLSENAFAPTRGSRLAAGFDLYRYTVHNSLLFHYVLPLNNCIHRIMI